MLDPLNPRILFFAVGNHQKSPCPGFIDYWRLGRIPHANAASSFISWLKQQQTEILLFGEL
jgi:hypothetical protein